MRLQIFCIVFDLWQIICHFVTTIYWKVGIYLKVNTYITYHARAIQCLGHEHELHQTNKETESKWAHNNTNKNNFCIPQWEICAARKCVFGYFAISSLRCEEFSAHEKLIFITLRVYTSANCICCDFYFLNLYYALLGLFRIKIRVKSKFYMATYIVLIWR